MGDITRTLAANSGEDIAKEGDFIFLRSAAADIDIVIDGQKERLSQGDLRLVTGGFKSFRIENTSAATNALRLVIGRGRVQRSEVSGNVTITQGATVAEASKTAGVGVTVAAAASATRRSVTFQNESPADAVRLGGAGVTNAIGLLLRPGDVYTANAAAAAEWSIIRDASAVADATVNVLEEST